eukprot:9140638-Pyramimonas_sp.AAC.1
MARSANAVLYTVGPLTTDIYFSKGARAFLRFACVPLFGGGEPPSAPSGFMGFFGKTGPRSLFVVLWVSGPT